MLKAQTFLLAIVPLLVACGSGSDKPKNGDDSKNGGAYGGSGQPGRGGGQGNGKGNGKGDDRPTFTMPVRAVLPTRALVEATVESQATLESDRFAEVVAEIEGRVVKRYRDVGDEVGREEDGEDALLLARLDDRDLQIAFREAEATILEKKGRIRELKLAQEQSQREIEQAIVSREEAQAALNRTTSGIVDGTISKEEHEKATFAFDLAKTKVAVAEAALLQADVALELGTVAVTQAELVHDRAKLNLARTSILSPIRGVVTRCDVQEGERIKASAAIFRIEDPSQLVVYGNLPVRQTRRIKLGNLVRISSSAIDESTTGSVVRIAPTVDPSSGTVRVKIAVKSAAGYKPGLFVTLRVVVETRAKALTVPKRAVLHDDADGAYLFVVEDGAAQRVLVETGYEKDQRVEIVKGVDAASKVVVEGQDTLTDQAKVELLAD